VETTPLGRDGLPFSGIALGAWQLGSDRGHLEVDAVTAIRRARESGVIFFEMAKAYCFGASVQIVDSGVRHELRLVSERRALKGARRAVIVDTSPRRWW
jgi:aryl-alcohol dehydrogenase-like predicted oxidoreductase